MEHSMETSAVQIPHQHHHHSHHHRSGKHQESHRKRRKKVMQRLAILFFILIVMLAGLYIWLSSGSPEATGQSLHSSSAKVEVASIWKAAERCNLIV
jgi:flagellar basal body-associated protein FliL